MMKERIPDFSYHPKDDHQLRPRKSPGETIDEAIANKKWRDSLHQGYRSELNLQRARAMHRYVGEPHPVDDKAELVAKPSEVDGKLLDLIELGIDKLPKGVSLASRMDWLLDQIQPPMDEDERHLYKSALGKRYAQRKTEAKDKSERLWQARMRDFKERES